MSDRTEVRIAEFVLSRPTAVDPDPSLDYAMWRSEIVGTVFAMVVFALSGGLAAAMDEGGAPASREQSSLMADSDTPPATRMPVVPDVACRYVNLACRTSLAPDYSLSPLVIADQLALAEANQDLDAALATFAPDATVRDYTGQSANGHEQIRQWLQLAALPAFRQHRFDSRQAAGPRVTWVDMLADRDGSLLAVLAEATVQRGEIQMLVLTDLPSPQAVPRPPDRLAPLIVGLLLPAVGWLALALGLKAADHSGAAPRPEACARSGRDIP